MNPGNLQCLAIKGNYFIDRHPDYRALILKHFSNLKEIDSLQVCPANSNNSSIRGQLRESNKLKHLLIPFLLKLDQHLQVLASQLSDGSQQLDKMEMVQTWNRIFAKDFSGLSNARNPKRPGSANAKVRGAQTRTVTATQIVNFIKAFDETVASSPSLPQEQSKASRQDL